MSSGSDNWYNLALVISMIVATFDPQLAFKVAYFQAKLTVGCNGRNSRN